jgi:hypothetical protein
MVPKAGAGSGNCVSLKAVGAWRRCRYRVPGSCGFMLTENRECLGTWAHVEVWRRAGGDEWTREEIAAGGVVRLETCGGGVAMNDLYRGGLEDAPPSS